MFDSRLHQALLTRLLQPVVGAIVGEEDGDTIDISKPPFRAGSLVAPTELESTIVQLRTLVDGIAAELPRLDEYRALTAFIDPIDGTKEFCTGQGEQCSICVGFADLTTGQAVAGLVYRPLCPERSWALGCLREATFESQLRAGSSAPPQEPAAGKFLISNSGGSAFVEALRSELHYEPLPAGGAGNKAMLVLEEPRAVYIQDRGVSRWDTCAAQAVVEAQGGLLVQLQPFCEDADSGAPPTLTPYTYKAGPVNCDFAPSVAKLTKYNAADGVLQEADLVKGAPPRLAATASELRPYANCLGLLALKSADEVEGVRAAVRKAKVLATPSFD